MKKTKKKKKITIKQLSEFLYRTNNIVLQHGEILLQLLKKRNKKWWQLKKIQCKYRGCKEKVKWKFLDDYFCEKHCKKQKKEWDRMIAEVGEVAKEGNKEKENAVCICSQVSGDNPYCLIHSNKK